MVRARSAHAALAAGLFVSVCAKLVTIDNTKPRLDNRGNILDCHDGNLQKLPGDNFYTLTCLSYGDCHEPAQQGCDQTPDKCGFRYDHNITFWRSPDLESGSWEFAGLALNWTDRPEGTVFRPDMVFNPNTGKYILWFNWVAKNGTYMGYAALEAEQASGPYRLVKEVVTLSHSNSTFNAGDFHIFVDEPDENGNATAYVIYGAEYNLWVDQLTPDFLSAAGPHYGPFGPYFVEAPDMFKRGDTYYAIFGHCCCFCFQGSGLLVYTASHPLGPWTAQGGDRACVPPPSGAAPSSDALEGATAAFLRKLRGEAPVPTPGQGCLYNNSNFVSVLRSQQSFTAKVDTPSGPAFLWHGDRWQQSPDGTKGHDPQYVFPLQFDEHGWVQEAQWLDRFSLDVI